MYRREGSSSAALPRGLLLAVAAVSTTILLPPGMEAQLPSRLDRLDSEYRAAVTEHQLALEAHAAIERRFSAAKDSAAAARARGDRDMERGETAKAEQLAGELPAYDARVDEAEKRLSGARTALIKEYGEWVDDLLDRLDTEENAAEQERLHGMIINARERRQELEDERGHDLHPPLPPPPVLTISPRDGPLELEGKVELAKRRVQQLEDYLEEADGQLQELKKQERQERLFRDFLARNKRFDAGGIIGGGSGRENTGGIGEAAEASPDDSTQVTRPLTLEERIKILEARKLRIDDLGKQWLNARRVFQERLDEVAGT